MLALACAAPVAAASPELDYTLNCAGCHRPDGVGTPGSVPPLAGSVGRFATVPGGREYLARVPGVATSALDDASLAAVLNWMLDHFGDGARAVPPYTAEDVGRLRREPLVNVERARRELIEKMEGR